MRAALDEKLRFRAAKTSCAVRTFGGEKLFTGSGETGVR